jgi:ligand-binding SRPBCC domain-containing protein
MKANIINIDLPLGTNSIIEVDIKQYGLNQKWLVQVDKMIPYNSVAEKALTSPFKAFYHERKIESIQNNKTLLKETITLSLPLFPLSLIALPLIKRDLQRMFEHRHRTTKAILER